MNRRKLLDWGSGLRVTDSPPSPEAAAGEAGKGNGHSMVIIPIFDGSCHWFVLVSVIGVNVGCILGSLRV